MIFDVICRNNDKAVNKRTQIHRIISRYNSDQLATLNTHGANQLTLTIKISCFINT